MLEIVSQSAHGFTLADFRDHVRVSGDDHDDALQRALDLAVQFVENSAGIFLRTTSVREYFRGSPNPYRLGRLPNDYSAVTVTNTDTSATVASTAYEVDQSTAWPRIRAKTAGAFAPDVVYSVAYSTGYTTVPPSLVVAVHEFAAMHFENRETATPVQMYAMPLAFSAILAQYGPRGL